jgi:hypothetical protein
MPIHRLTAGWMPARFTPDGNLTLDDACLCACGQPVARALLPGAFVVAHAATCNTYLPHGHGSVTSFRGSDVAIVGSVWCAVPQLDDAPLCGSGVAMAIDGVRVRCARCAGPHARDGLFYLVPAVEVAENEDAVADDTIYALCQPCGRFFPRAWRARLVTVTLRAGAVAVVVTPNGSERSGSDA